MKRCWNSSLAHPPFARATGFICSSDNLLLSLPRERRSQLYKYLSQFHPNSFHESPVYFPGSNVRLWAQGTKLAQDKIDLIGGPF